ncbi:MAG: MarC family protein [Candidatus Binatia bacterium]
MSLVDFGVLAFGSLFVIVDPIATVPAFLAMTHSKSREERIAISKAPATVTFLVLFAFSLGGQWVLRFFGVTIPAFEIAGGIILLKVALDMLQARRPAMRETPEEQAEGARKEDIGVTPLAVPMLAGPGAISAVVLLRGQAATLAHLLLLVAVVAAISLLVFLILRMAATHVAFFSGIGIRIIERLMGLLLAAIAVQFVLNGLTKIDIFR